MIQTSDSKPAWMVRLAARLPLSPGGIAGGVIPATGMLLALLLLAVRPRVAPDLLDQDWFQVLLLAASWFVAAVLWRESASRTAAPNGVLALFGILTGTALIVWSGSIAMALSVGLPVAGVLVVNLAAKAQAWQLTTTVRHQTVDRDPSSGTGDDRSSGPAIEFGGDRHSPPQADTRERQHPTVDSPEPGISREPDGEEDLEDAEGDVWRAVLSEFAVDPGLVQNLTRWETSDGQQTMVAHLRCQLPESGVTNVHLPLWPFLPGNPEVFCRHVDGPSAEIRVVQCRPGGIVVAVQPAGPHPPGSRLILEIVAVAREIRLTTPAA